MDTALFRTEAEAMREELVRVRRDFHQHPELAFQEIRTASIVAQQLSDLGMEVQTGVGRTGVVGILEGAHDGPTVLVRADMDALPIIEANKIDYISDTSGKMHACGHDGHTAIALGVAKLFAQQREKIAGRIKFVFQPAEEIAQGAEAMVGDGVLRDPVPDVVLGLHLWNSMPVGKVGVADGPVMAGASDFTIHLMGKGGHGASPHQAVDPVICAAHIATALQTIVSRNVDPLDTAVVSVTQIHAGTAHNVIPSEAMLNGTIRTFRSETRQMIEIRLRALVNGIAEAMGCTASIRSGDQTEPVVNDPDVARHVRESFLKMGVQEEAFVYERTMGAEDVGVLMKDIPGMYFFVGSGNSERGLDYPHHHPQFDFDESVLPFAVSLLASAVADYVLEA